MTDRISYLTVVLDQDIRDDDVQAVIDALGQNRHVISVKAGAPVNHTDHVARERLRFEMRGKVLDLFEES